MESRLINGGECRLKVTGFSMTPILRNEIDSVILTSPINRKIKKGDIVFIKRKSGKYVLHRVYKFINDDYFIMNGDAQQWTEVININQVIGVVKDIIRRKRKISCNNLLYKYLVKIWMGFKPIRPYLLVVYWKFIRTDYKTTVKNMRGDKR